MAEICNSSSCNMEYDPTATNAIWTKGDIVIQSAACLCMHALDIPHDVKKKMQTGDNDTCHQLVRTLQAELEELVNNPPQQHQSDGHPAHHLFRVTSTIGGGGQATVVTVQHMNAACSVGTLNKQSQYDPASGHSSQDAEQHVLKVFAPGKLGQSSYAAQEVALSVWNMGPSVLKSSAVGIVWLRFHSHQEAQPALAMLMPRLFDGTLSDMFTKWQLPGASKPSAQYLLQVAFDLLLTVITMHKHGVVHWDIKAANIGILHGRLVALDLGLGRVGSYSRSAENAAAEHSAILDVEVHIASEEGDDGTVQLLEQLKTDYTQGLTALEELEPDFVFKADVYGLGVMLLQIMTYGKPPFWMANSLSPISTQDLSRKMLKHWVALGARQLLQDTYWYPLLKCQYQPIVELDQQLLDLVSQALAPPWRRPNAEQLASHGVFAQVGPYLVQELDGPSLKEHKHHLEDLLRCWSLYHTEAAKQLCSRYRAAEVLRSSDSAEVKRAAQQAWQEFSQNRQGPSMSVTLPTAARDLENEKTVASGDGDDGTEDEGLFLAAKTTVMRIRRELRMAVRAAAERSKASRGSAAALQNPRGSSSGCSMALIMPDAGLSVTDDSQEGWEQMTDLDDLDDVDQAFQYWHAVGEGESEWQPFNMRTEIYQAFRQARHCLKDTTIELDLYTGSYHKPFYELTFDRGGCQEDCRDMFTCEPPWDPQDMIELLLSAAEDTTLHLQQSERDALRRAANIVHELLPEETFSIEQHSSN